MLTAKKFTRKIIDIELIKVKKTFNTGREWIGDAQDHILLKSIKMTGQPIHDIIGPKNTKNYFIILKKKKTNIFKYEF